MSYKKYPFENKTVAWESYWESRRLKSKWEGQPFLVEQMEASIQYWAKIITDLTTYV